VLRQCGALLRVGLAESIAYRVEALIWLLSTTMPFVKWSLFHTLAADAPVGTYDQRAFTLYFVSAFLVRNTTGSWAAWQMNMDIREGTLSVRLLRPVFPLLSYATDNLAALPIRGAVCLPVAAAFVWSTQSGERPQGPAWVALAFSLLCAWLLNLLANMVIGLSALFFESTIKWMELYTVAFSLSSGYFVPLDVFPPSVRAVLSHLPFRYQLGFPVDVLIGRVPMEAAWGPLAEGAAYVLLLGSVAALLWTRGMRRFAAYGG
jgi:ABC-2 type transport system permease protein